MKKVQPPLKWMAEKRARIAGDLAKHERTERQLQRHVAQLSRSLHRAQQQADQAQPRIEALRQDLDALDHAIVIFDPSLSPTNIPAINGFAGRYGRRGAMKDFVAQVLQREGDWVPSDVCSALVQAYFGIEFETPEAKSRWERNSLREALRQLQMAGVIECNAPPGQTGVRKSWRWKQSRYPTLAELRQQAARIEAGERSSV